MTFHDYKTLYAAALERLCEEYPEADLDDLKREAEKQVEQQVTQMAKAANNNDNKQTDRR